MSKKELLTFKTYIIGKMLNVIERFFGVKQAIQPRVNGYYLKKKLTQFSDKKYSSMVELYGKGYKRMIVKSYNYTFNNLKYFQFLNEMHMSNLLSRLSQKASTIIYFPRVLHFSDFNGQIKIGLEYIKAKPLKEVLPDEKIYILTQIIKDFERMSEFLSINKKKTLPKRSPLIMHLVLPVYVFHAIRKDLAQAFSYIYLLISYFKNIRISEVIEPEYVLSHRDLHSQNVLVKNKQPIILDNEICTLAEKGTDLAIICRYFIKELGIKRVLKLIELNTETRVEKSKFIHLTIFYTIQHLAGSEGDREFRNLSFEYLKVLVNTIIPQINHDLLRTRSLIGRVK